MIESDIALRDESTKSRYLLDILHRSAIGDE